MWMFCRLGDGTSSMERSKMLTKGCKDCESQFRRDVLIDRLVSDSLQVLFKSTNLWLSTYIFPEVQKISVKAEWLKTPKVLKTLQKTPKRHNYKIQSMHLPCCTCLGCFLYFHFYSKLSLPTLKELMYYAQQLSLKPICCYNPADISAQRGRYKRNILHCTEKSQILPRRYQRRLLYQSVLWNTNKKEVLGEIGF